MKILTCLKCNHEILTKDSERKYCSRSCSNSMNNILKPKRLPEGNCSQCGNKITKSRKFCDNCRKLRKAEANSKRTKIGRNTKHVTSWRQRLKKKAIEYKGGSCSRCNYSKSVRALTFHHLDPQEKDFGIGSGDTKSWETVKKELDKCILLCANCHAEEHDLITAQ